uniref:DBF4-type zinc finger-containing protein 2 homolog n=1 Tax=Callithrix jacchus TaxID=9483 RepID=UPI0023DCF5D0|nr:DBF4-type zinc finger-containing protein 2 homolog [Callithrix jacchus]
MPRSKNSTFAPHLLASLSVYASLQKLHFCPTPACLSLRVCLTPKTPLLPHTCLPLSPCMPHSKNSTFAPHLLASLSVYASLQKLHFCPTPACLSLRVCLAPKTPLLPHTCLPLSPCMPRSKNSTFAPHLLASLSVYTSLQKLHFCPTPACLSLRVCLAPKTPLLPHTCLPLSPCMPRSKNCTFAPHLLASLSVYASLQKLHFCPTPACLSLRVCLAPKTALLPHTCLPLSPCMPHSKNCTFAPHLLASLSVYASLQKLHFCPTPACLSLRVCLTPKTALLPHTCLPLSPCMPHSKNSTFAPHLLASLSVYASLLSLAEPHTQGLFSERTTVCLA